ncbi:MAG: 16S rRNA (uracil(1498)-N(3))-methyltransferase [Bacteroidales bacterium]|nr:16S rRNA (uracil(1498)-N(3))-methyltransferase [Bacteroidales bacterium]
MEIFYSNDIDGTSVRLNSEESAHCVRVLRHRAGDEIAVMDGRGTLLRCVLEEASPSAAVARIARREPGFGAHPYHLTLAVCPTKNMDRYEWMAEKATEIGVDVIAPVIGERSERKVCKTDRLERLVLSAAKQSLKASVPVVSQPVSVLDFIASFSDTPSPSGLTPSGITSPLSGLTPSGTPSSLSGTNGGTLKLIAYCFEGEKVSIKDALAASNCSNIVVLIGPEGDFSPKEVAAALRAGFKPVHLGTSRLRTETAALISAAAVYFDNL